MPHFFYVLDGDFFHAQVRPALAECRRRRSFVPCRALCHEILTQSARLSAAERADLTSSLVARVAEGLPFDARYWPCLVGEVLAYGAVACPRLELDPRTLCCLLAPERLGLGRIRREALTPIEQVFFGTGDLVFGPYPYLPKQAGLNDRADVARLAGYLQSINPCVWTTDALVPLLDLPDPEARADELAQAQDWWPDLVRLYQTAHMDDCILIVETLERPPVISDPSVISDQ